MNINIDKNIKVPIFEQITTQIIKNIELGNIKPEDKLPTERMLAESLSVARGTVKNAYKKLENEGIIKTTRGSGSYILKSKDILDNNKRLEVLEIIDATISTLMERELSIKEIVSLINLYISTNHYDKIIKIAIVNDLMETLEDFKNQLSYLRNSSISMFTFENVTEMILESFDIIVVNSTLHNQILNLLPHLKNKVIEAIVSPSCNTIMEISSLERKSRIGIIYRTTAFLNAIELTLTTYGFNKKNIFSFFEDDYTTKTYFKGGIHALISFSNAYIFKSADFEKQNDEFLRKGGKLIKFEYSIEKITLDQIDDKINLIGESSSKIKLK